MLIVIADSVETRLEICQCGLLVFPFSNFSKAGFFAGGAMTQRIPMTPNGKRKLMERLKYLKQVERPRNVEAIEVARGHGDLSENADYDAAKEKQRHISREMQDVENQLALSQVIDPATLDSEKIVFGATVTIANVADGEEMEYYIVGTDEADIEAGKISIQSPIARALIGKEEGDEANVKTPKGVRTIEVVSVEYK
jgi:transcription elongation factor GreA